MRNFLSQLGSKIKLLFLIGVVLIGGIFALSKVITLQKTAGTGSLVTYLPDQNKVRLRAGALVYNTKDNTTVVVQANEAGDYPVATKDDVKAVIVWKDSTYKGVLFGGGSQQEVKVVKPLIPIHLGNGEPYKGNFFSALPIFAVLFLICGAIGFILELLTRERIVVFDDENIQFRNARNVHLTIHFLVRLTLYGLFQRLLLMRSWGNIIQSGARHAVESLAQGQTWERFREDTEDFTERLLQSSQLSRLEETQGLAFKAVLLIDANLGGADAAREDEINWAAQQGSALSDFNRAFLGDQQHPEWVQLVAAFIRILQQALSLQAERGEDHEEAR